MGAELRRSPRFLGHPCARAALCVPGALSAPRLSGAPRVAFTSLERLGGRDETVSGIVRAARSLAVYASQPPSPTSTQHSLPGGWLGLTGRDLHPLGSYLKFLSSVTRSDSFLFSQACLAHLVLLSHFLT